MPPIADSDDHEPDQSMSIPHQAQKASPLAGSVMASAIQEKACQKVTQGMKGYTCLVEFENAADFVEVGITHSFC